MDELGFPNLSWLPHGDLCATIVSGILRSARRRSFPMPQRLDCAIFLQLHLAFLLSVSLSSLNYPFSSWQVLASLGQKLRCLYLLIQSDYVYHPHSVVGAEVTPLRCILDKHA